MIKIKYKAAFIENECYHIYNRTNNQELLYRNDINYSYFLKKFEEITVGYLYLYSWNLQPTHFHLCVKVKSFEAIINYINTKPVKDLCVTEKKFKRNKATIHELIDNVFQRFLISYCMSYNSMYDRKGNLLHRPFKHIHVNKESQFTQTIIYINANAVKHNIVKDISDYKWSSYHTIISDIKTNLCRNEILEWFGGRDQFIKTMKEQTAYYYSCETGIEEE